MNILIHHLFTFQYGAIWIYSSIVDDGTIQNLHSSMVRFEFEYNGEIHTLTQIYIPVWCDLNSLIIASREGCEHIYIPVWCDLNEFCNSLITS